ncbi:MAG: Fpg/Nei family DNA glycosylase [Actinomycetota bacterium]|nr:Fpg/Nei family DNA glycosylase [Actinomycetota bacterium]
MPEGHTLHRLARAVQRRFRGGPLRITSPQGRFAAGAELIDGATLRRAEANGKHLLLDLGEDRHLHVHLGLFGRTTIGEAPAPQPVGAVRMRIETDAAYLDLRGATVCEVLTGTERARLLGRLGPDPLRRDADPDRAWVRLSRSTRPVAALLMDQSVVSGVGNAFRAEVLFRHGLDPAQPGSDLTKVTWDALWADLSLLLADGVRTGRIRTLRPEHGRNRRTGPRHYVYRRAGERCLVCAQPVSVAELAGRRLYWCDSCQAR